MGGYTNSKCMRAADIYSLGYTLAIMLDIEDDKHDRIGLPACIRTALQAIIRMCMDEEPMRRPNAEQAHRMLLAVQNVYLQSKITDVVTFGLEDLSLHAKPSTIEGQLTHLAGDWEAEHQARILRAKTISELESKLEPGNSTLSVPEGIAGGKPAAAKSEATGRSRTPTISPNPSAASSP